MNVRVRLVVVFAVMLVAGCRCGADPTHCIGDSDCDTTNDGSRKCDVTSGTCLCANDHGCDSKSGEKCNAAGRCQAEGGCITNDDCGSNGVAQAGLFCDLTTSSCLSVDECNPQQGQSCCTLDDQCPFGHICDAVSRACIPGCRDDADCVLGEGCAGAGFGHLGQCGTSCTADNQCPAAFLCNHGLGKCEKDTRGPYCQACSGGVASKDCGTPGNYCLLDPTDPTAQAEFCGVDCSVTGIDSCPNAYTCQQVIILPPASPTCGIEICDPASATCSSTHGPCTKNEDCPEGPPFGDCPQQVGRHGTCAQNANLDCTVDDDCASVGGSCTQVKCEAGAENSQFGTCTCTRNSDCPTDTCTGADNSDPAHPVPGHCELSGHQCFKNPDCDVIACVNGGCLIGSNCAPSNDRSCADLAGLAGTTQGQ